MVRYNLNCPQAEPHCAGEGGEGEETWEAGSRGKGRNQGVRRHSNLEQASEGKVTQAFQPFGFESQRPCQGAGTNGSAAGRGQESPGAREGESLGTLLAASSSARECVSWVRAILVDL